jgi:serine/threonine protein kinase
MTASAPPDASLVEDLLLRWQDARDRGAPRSADDLCRDHPELRDRVRERVAALEAMHALLGLGPAGSGGAASTRPADTPQPRTGSPPDIAGYEPLVLVGEGGMGSVYRTRQLGLQRPVAIKMIRAGRHARADQLARFAAEAEAVARLRHPNIVQIYEVGEWHGQPYFSMEYVAEGNLAQRLARGLIPPREVAEVVRALAGAVHHAHERGVIHRDLKPANILLAGDRQKETGDRGQETGDRGQETGDRKAGRGGSELSPVSCPLSPVITDFGLAKFLDEEGTTRTGTVLGTPQYLAPEQVEGKAGEVGPHTDIHALGVVLYEMLTGRPPYLGTNTLEILEQVRGTDPVPPSRTQPRVPAELEVICLKCLAKEPGRRYASAADLADDLGRYLRGEPIRARPTPAWRRATRWARREPWVAGLGTLAAVAVVALLAVWVNFTQQLRSAAAGLKTERDEAARLHVLAEDGQRTADAEKGRAEYLLFRCMSAIDEHARATEQSREVKVRTGDPGSIPYVVARVYAASANVYRNDAHLSDADRDRFGERYAAQAVELLGRAAEHGYFESDANRAKFLADPDLAVLRDRHDFRAFLAKFKIKRPKS